jgi:hypothetical protein
MHRSAPRLARILACATVPVMLVAGCSSGSDDDKDSDGTSRQASPSASPSIAAAKFNKLPDVCSALSRKTIGGLVPNAENEKGKALQSADTNTSASCLWNGLNGFKYRSLSVSLKLFRSDAGLGSGDKRAQAYATQQASKAATADGTKNAKTAKAAGVGDEATTVRTEEKKDGDEFRNQTVVARTANVVVTVEYDGAGYESAKAPDATKLLKDAESAAKEVIGTITKGTDGGSRDSGSSASPSKGSGGSKSSKGPKASTGSKKSKSSS